MLARLEVLIALGTLAFWAAVAARLWLAARAAAWLGRLPAEGTSPLPPLSVVVAARNEGAHVEPALQSLLALDYPDLQVVAVDDRSDDETGPTLDRLALGASRLHVLHVRALPGGWLGKNHALHLGSQAATGSWILFTDSDVHFEPSALRRAVRHAEARGLDHLAVLPDLDLRAFMETLFVSLFATLFSIHTRAWSVGNPRSRAHIGIGAFNLVRTSTYRRMGGHAVLAMEVTDDVTLGKRMKASGGRQELAMSGGMVRVRWVAGLGGAIRGLTKNMYAGLNYSPWRGLASAALVLLGVVWPGPGLFVGPWAARAMCAAVLISMAACARLAPPVRPSGALYGLLYPLAGVFFTYALVASMAHAHWHGGVIWRGTHYPLSELRRGRA